MSQALTGRRFSGDGVVIGSVWKSAALGFGIMSDRRLAIFAGLFLGFVALLLVAAWHAVGLLD
jgi:hypothetical protein